jgi:hypothetical protein
MRADPPWALRVQARVVGALASLVLLAGCATPPAPLYDWGHYPLASYQFMRGDGFDPRASIVRLEDQLQKTAAARRNPPPGLHGHLALLYSGLGDMGRAKEHLERERELFPEAATFVEFLLQNARRESKP